MSQTNAQGLSRNIPATIKRDVRKRSKFGCVICRGLLCEYEHIDPPFADATEHNPERICLLCPTHHAEVTRRLLSKDQVTEAYRRVQNSGKIKPPFYELHLAGTNFRLILGDCLFTHFPAGSPIISIDNDVLLSIDYIKVDDAVVPSLSGKLYGAAGNVVLSIEDNIITAAHGQFDIRCEANIIKIYSEEENLSLRIKIEPPDQLAIEQLEMSYRGASFLLRNDHFSFRPPGMPRTQVAIEAAGATSAIHFVSDPAKWHRGSPQITGGRGILMPGGLTIAKGNASMLLKYFAIYP